MTSGFAARRLTVAVALLVSMGCYRLQPVAGQPLPLGSVVSLGITDAGRTILGGQMGPEVLAIEGRLVQKDSAEYVVAVAQVRLLRGGIQVWSGEHVRVKSEFVSVVSEEQFSGRRTALVGVAAVGVVAFLISQGILGSLIGDEGKTPPDTLISQKYPRFIKR